uniref:Cytochrome b5 heme-binding domain-containing protein n=1 Tax=Paramoeba aestuarina TaxID=180227 RepID=A0A7S4KCN1_9EUKA|mmetsp:Transcript_17125/g.26725  ORF Transcript_17125/g.26725 Transcript_17125/m.26725 type:complete len:180 (+) Transcript_17125:64-603(+)|eukprot:CAMPEP_0201519008 /NCGR_PEP_ID=MMETSP0161_2-20130828/9684_1 /ASSEMBLY_ACC=CAM_ASM_000251 /TAXON_ID=180227 /ORGANISM="Neoparamoeba aestuarina, Strain SoJaBio B1-5/56/2" /LENGTH=179 /DNA_ID=CAMNT_0047916929 /DNA_START=49 /DNA_END=588 /DNA_ORIENTATION=-
MEIGENLDIEDLTPCEDHENRPVPRLEEVLSETCQCTSPANCDCLDKGKDCSGMSSNPHAFATSSFEEEGNDYQSLSPPSNPLSCPASQKTSFFFNTPLFTREEVAKHNTPEDCWLVANGNVYDATSYLHEHPAGPRAILRRAGKDVTTDFEFHSASAQKRFKTFKIGEVAEETSCSIC